MSTERNSGGPSNSARSVPIDFWKAASILGVVWIHCSYLIPHAHAILDWLSPLFQFCVPVFVMFWAYFMEKSRGKPGWSYAKSLSRLGRLALPFFAWSTIYWIMHGDFRSDLPHQISRYWSGYGWPGQYFFVILAQLIVAAPLLVAVARLVPPWANAAVAIFAPALLGATFHPTPMLERVGDRPFVYWIPFCVLGIHLARGRISASRIPWWVVACVLPLIPLEVKFSGNSLAGIGPYLSSSISLATFLIGVSACQGSLPRWARKAPFRGWIVRLSTNSMAIFCINPLILIVGSRITASFTPLNFPGDPVLAPLASTLLATASSLLLASLVRRVGLARILDN
jgi:surface polysaccharide O-acyltransferase-like enzyme